MSLVVFDPYFEGVHVRFERMIAVASSESLRVCRRLKIVKKEVHNSPFGFFSDCALLAKGETM
jgi:hypothetical protein